MPFRFAAALALFLEIAGPLLAIAFVAWRVRPRASAGVWGAGLAAAPLGSVLFLAAVFAQQVVATAVPDSIANPAPGWRPLLAHGLVAGLVAGVVEETIRFGVGFLLFRRAKGRPLVAALLFGLGWGAVECALVAASHVPELSFRLQLYGSAGAVPMPFAPLLVTAERLAAMLLHVSLAGFAAAAAMALARRHVPRAAMLFGAAVALHTVLDAWIRVMFVRYPLELGAGGPLLTLSVFLAGGALAIFCARRLGAEPPVTSGAAAPAA